ncbi:MAG: lipoyl(octanoyl) transferase LipB [Planctomycetota bacterium]
MANPEIHDLNRDLEVLLPGELSYADAFDRQRRLHAERVAGERGDTLVLLTHPKVVTMGRGSHAENLLRTPEELVADGFEIHETDRGGDVTYHGPGQLVGYPIVDLRPLGLGPRDYLRRLEGSLIDLLGTYGVEGRREEGLTGVWTDAGKVAAIGIRISRGVTMHGFALNVTTALTDFDVIVPCGIHDRAVARLADLVDEDVTVDSVAKRYPACLARALAR